MISTNMECLLNLSNIFLYVKNDCNKFLSKGDEIDLKFVMENFAGQVCDNIDDYNTKFKCPETITFIAGNVDYILNCLGYDKKFDRRIVIVTNFSNEQTYSKYESEFDFFTSAMLPINIHNLGIYIRCLFDDETQYNNYYYDKITKAHDLISLTESNKSSMAFRTGRYLTKITQHDSCPDDENCFKSHELHYKYMRCSTNFQKGTHNFYKIDNEIIDKTNRHMNKYFTNCAEFNHVLAQAYHNKIDEFGKSRHANISKHSDKTEDMPENALIGFFTSYKFDPSVEYGYQDFEIFYKNQLVLTKLNFERKHDVDIELYPTKQFSISLYPGSVLAIPLSTNRLYTHEIKTPGLNPNILPTRLGYVMKSSKTNAIYDVLTNKTYIEDETGRTEMHPITEEEMKYLRDMYFQENVNSQRVVYDNMYYSMNDGDYMIPEL